MEVLAAGSISMQKRTESIVKQVEEDLDRSLDLAKAGYENAQSRIALLDTKAGAAMGLIVLLLPVPLLVVAWLSGLGGDLGVRCLRACVESKVLVWLTGLFLLSGWFAAALAMVWGIRCLIPRGAKGHDKSGPFHNEWRPNILFPMFDFTCGEQQPTALAHFKRLRAGVSKQFAIEEYEHQLEQLGRILGEKFTAMTQCFIWLKRVLVLYAIGLFLGLMLLLPGIFGQHVPVAVLVPAAIKA